MSGVQLSIIEGNHDARVLPHSKIRITGTHQRIRHSTDHRRVGHWEGGFDRYRRSAKALNLLIPNHFDISSSNEIIADVLIKSILLRRLTKDRLVKFIMEQVKPFMSAQDILQVQLDLEILLTVEVE